MVKYRDDKVDALGFVKKGEEIVLYMACVRKYDDGVVMYAIPQRMLTDKYLDEICEYAIGASYKDVIEAIRNNGEDNNVMWKHKGEFIFTRYPDGKVTYRE